MTASATLTGNLTRDPELRYTSSGQAVASISIADTPRRRNASTGEFEPGETSYYTATVWGAIAENVAESLHKGDRVLLTGRLVERSFTATRGERQGETVRRHEIVVDEIGAALRFATVTVTKATRQGATDTAEEVPI
jgi:single-strand DNA-binding protein